METETPISKPVWEAVQVVRGFVAETTGQAPTDTEIADALKRYFVLNEIKEHILMIRNEAEAGGADDNH
jgi:hypothetical protein